MSIKVWFGYEIPHASHELYDMNEVIPLPFQFHCISEEQVILGFPVETLERTRELAEELAEWIQDNPLLYSIDMNETPLFYGEYLHSDSELDSELDSDSDSDSDSDDSDESEDSSEGSLDADSDEESYSETDSECSR